MSLVGGILQLVKGPHTRTDRTKPLYLKALQHYHKRRSHRQQIAQRGHPRHLSNVDIGYNNRPTSLRSRFSSSATYQVRALRTLATNTSHGLNGSRNGLPVYHPPDAGLVALLPSSWIPYAELMRLDKPAGTYYLFFPCLFSTLFAASYVGAPIAPVLSTSTLFFAGALIMRGAGCTINDLWDRDLDPYVLRTRLRPIARRAVSPFNALTFAGIECLAGLGVLLQFPTTCLYYGVPSLILVFTYPLAKRVTHYPQFILGLTFSWGAIMGFPALGIDLLSNGDALKAVAALYASCVSWTVLYDMIYAHMDIKDDAKVGIKSIALRHEKETKAVLSGLAIMQISLLASAGAILGASPIFFVGSCGSAAATLGLMIWKVKLKDIGSCWWWFKNGVWFTGGAITSGLLAEYLFAPNQRSGKVDTDTALELTSS